MFSWLFGKKKDEEPKIEIEYSNVCEDFIDGEVVVDTRDDVFVKNIGVITETPK